MVTFATWSSSFASEVESGDDEFATGDTFRRVRFGSTLAPLDAGGTIQMAADFVAVVDSLPLDVPVPLLLRQLPPLPPPLLVPFCCGCLNHDSSLVCASLVWPLVVVPLTASTPLPSQSVVDLSVVGRTSSSSFLSKMVRFNDGPAVPDGSASTLVTNVVAREEVVVDVPGASVTTG